GERAGAPPPPSAPGGRPTPPASKSAARFASTSLGATALRPELGEGTPPSTGCTAPRRWPSRARDRSTLTRRLRLGRLPRPNAVDPAFTLLRGHVVVVACPAMPARRKERGGLGRALSCRHRLHPPHLFP